MLERQSASVKSADQERQRAAPSLSAEIGYPPQGLTRKSTARQLSIYGVNEIIDKRQRMME
jgi:hypothetical protein